MATGTIKSTKAIDSTLGNGSSGITQFGRVWKDPNTHTCRIQVVARSETDISYSNVLAVVPIGFRPAGNYALYGVFYTGSKIVAAYYGSVGTNGNITQSLGSTVREVFLTGEYPYAD